MKRVIAIAMQKGGVGKTTTAVNLAASLAATRRRVLLMDLDPQGNATMGSGIDKRTRTKTVYHVLLGAADISSVCVGSRTGNYDVVPANRELAGADFGVEAPAGEIQRRETHRRQWRHDPRRSCLGNIDVRRHGEGRQDVDDS